MKRCLSQPALPIPKVKETKLKIFQHHTVADPDGGYGGFNPLFSSGSGTFLIEMVLVLSESDESEYVISNVLNNVLVLNYLSFKVNGRNILVNEPFT